VKAAIPDRTIPLSEIFSGSIPYWLLLLLVIAIVAIIPQVATFLPSL
jgi:TRAP-type mannitol/chloroaromatic compound transport system permease large subunit